MGRSYGLATTDWGGSPHISNPNTLLLISQSCDLCHARRASDQMAMEVLQPRSLAHTTAISWFYCTCSDGILWFFLTDIILEIMHVHVIYQCSVLSWTQIQPANNILWGITWQWTVGWLLSRWEIKSLWLNQIHTYTVIIRPGGSYQQRNLVPATVTWPA